MIAIRTVAVAVLFLASLAACEIGSIPGESVVVRDSAGVQIVESAAPRWREGEEWRVADTPRVSVGSALGEPATQFGSIDGLTRLTDGRLVVLDGRSFEMRFFDSTGVHLLSVGRKGSGPGEFNSTMLRLSRLSGDSLLVREPMPPRQSLFAPSGEFVRSVRPTPLPGSPFPGTAWGHFANGTALLTSVRVIEDRAGSWIDSTPFFVAAAGSDSAVPFLRLPSHRYSNDGGMTATLAFGPAAQYTVGGDRFYHGFPERFEISVYTPEGRLERVIRRAWSPVAVPEAIRSAHRDSALARAQTPLMRERAQSRQYAEHFPAFDLLVADAAGNLWVRAARTDEAVVTEGARQPRSMIWSVFDSSGVWLGDVRMPEGLDVREIGSDYVAGIAYDEDDVPTLRVHGLIKP